MRDFASWVILLDGPAVYFGKRTPTGAATSNITLGGSAAVVTEVPRVIELEPVYQLTVNVQPARDGKTTIHRALMPVMLYSGIRKLTWGTDRPLIVVADTLTRAELAQLDTALTQVEDMVNGLRAAAAGITVAPASALPKGNIR